MNTAQLMDIGAQDKVKGKQGAGSPRGTANENPDKDVQCPYCGKKGHRTRECRKTST